MLTVVPPPDPSANCHRSPPDPPCRHTRWRWRTLSATPLPPVAPTPCAGWCCPQVGCVLGGGGEGGGQHRGMRRGEGAGEWVD
jgi:hypothetical protein